MAWRRQWSSHHPASAKGNAKRGQGHCIRIMKLPGAAVYLQINAASLPARKHASKNALNVNNEMET